MMTAIESWKKEGKMEGKKEGKKEGKMEGELKGKINFIESFLKTGINWSVIKQAVGIDPQSFQQLKEKYNKLTSEPVIA